MNTIEAFQTLIKKRGWYNGLEIADSTARTYAKRFRDGKLPIERIEEILLKAGFEVIQEKLWKH